MAIGLVGRKCGMTRIFTEAGESVPVTVVEVLPNRVTQVKSVENDGYAAVQVTYGARRPQLQGFCHLPLVDAGRTVEVGDGLGHPTHPVQAAGREGARPQPPQRDRIHRPGERRREQSPLDAHC